MTRGEDAYTAYGNAVEWLSYDGQPLPAWAMLPAKIRAAWEQAAAAAAAWGDK